MVILETENLNYEIQFTRIQKYTKIKLTHSKFICKR